MNEPPVKLAIRTGGSPKNYQFRFENEWPIARTQWTKSYLRVGADRQSATGEPEAELVSAPVQEPRSISYAASPPSHAGVGSSAPSHAAGSVARTGVSFVTAPMQEDAEVTGPMVLVIWVSSSSEDMDIFATVRNIGPDGRDVWEEGQQGGEDLVPVTKGWLRASHRKLDPERSLPYRRDHAHTERLWLAPGDVVECHLQIWPTSMVFKKGHRIRIDVQPRDGVGASAYRHYHADYNIGAQNTVHAGGDRQSYLLLPIIPAKGE